MFSNSSSYLGAGNSARPGAPQYGQQSFQTAQQGPPQPNSFNQQPTGFGGNQQQQNSLAQQPTGFTRGQINPQYTGYPNQGPQPGFQAQQQPQLTGYPNQSQQPIPNAAAPQQSFQTGQPPQSQNIPQKTGQTSSQIAQSFQGTPASQSPAKQPPTSGTKIPKIRLSFLTATDQAKFEQLFKSAVGDAQALDGETHERQGRQNPTNFLQVTKLGTCLYVRSCQAAI